MGNERNKLRGSMASLLGRQAEDEAPAGVQLANKGGRPPKDRPSAWNSKRDYRTSLVMDREQYNVIRRLSNVSGQTLKELMFVLLEEGLKRYESGELKIRNIREESAV